jgi:hypothetical protein
MNPLLCLAIPDNQPCHPLSSILACLQPSNSSPLQAFSSSSHLHLAKPYDRGNNEQSLRSIFLEWGCSEHLYRGVFRIGGNLLCVCRRRCSGGSAGCTCSFEKLRRDLWESLGTVMDVVRSGVGEAGPPFCRICGFGKKRGLEMQAVG